MIVLGLVMLGATCVARGTMEDVFQCVTHPLVALQIERHRKVEATAFALALAPRHLTAALQRRAAEWDVRVIVHFGLGDAVSLTLEENEECRGLLVVGRSREATSEAAQRFRRLALGSWSPVLLV